MHGFNSGPVLLVNAEVDSMGGVVDGGVGFGTKPSPRRAAIEKAQTELRLEYDVREERRRELEYLEKGGDPLDFKFGHAASVSVQSTSRTDQQHPDQILASEAKGSFALTGSPHWDSVESSGRLGVTAACEPNSADNFDGENEILQSDRKSMHPGRGSTVPSEHSSQFDGRSNFKESEDSPFFHPKKGQAYRRRNQSRLNRDSSRSSSADMASRGGHGLSMPGRHEILSKPVASENQLEVESDGTHILHSSINSRSGEFAEGKKHKMLTEKQEETPSLKTDDDPAAITIVEPASVAGTENIDSVDVECPSCSISDRTADPTTSTQLNETRKMNGEEKCTPTDALINNTPVLLKGLDSESSCSQTNVSVDGNGTTDSVLYTCLKNVDCNGGSEGHKLPLQEKSVCRGEKKLEKYISSSMETSSCAKEDQSSIGHQENGFIKKYQDEIEKGRSSQVDESKVFSGIEEQEKSNHAETKSDNELGQCSDIIPKMETSCPVSPLPSLDLSLNELNNTDVSAPPPFLEPQPCTENKPKPLDKAQEDSILEKARIIEAKRKRIAELSNSLLPREHRRKCQWDFVLEEMAWLANDFAQERLWKVTAAAQICHRVAFASRRRLEEQVKHLKQKSEAHSLAKAVMDFWQSARFSVENADVSQLENCKSETSSGAMETELAKCKAEICTEGKASQDLLKSARRKQDLGVHGYAVRFLQWNCSFKPQVEVSGTPDVACDIDLPEILWQDQLTEENLFYAVPPGAMEMYRKSIESSLADDEMVGHNIQEEVNTSAYDAAAKFRYQDNDCEEDEGENLYYQPGGFDTGRQSKKKRKSMKYAARPFEYGSDFGYGHFVEDRNGTPQSAVLGKRPFNSLPVDPIPTKRMRTASRQRLVSPFGALPVLCRADASSGDTNSFQDDQSTLHGGLVLPRGSEVDSAMNFEKHSTFDSADIAAKPKKRKKIKHKSVAYDQTWQMDSSMHSEQKDHLRKRLDNQQFESNGNSGLHGQHAKKPKTMKHSLDTSFDNMMPASGSVASPVASQMSNMSSQNKIIKLYGGRDRGRKAKGIKVPTGQLGSGSPWTVYEDQALVVLVHDMGPNWDFVSDAINSMLQFKCIFRKPQDCKERHKCLMESTSGDGADSAEDSGSSQPYPSTLPGIPKGSARQLFRSLHAPVVEDNIKSHFEKIIRIGQQLHYRRKQNDNQDLKQLAAVHGSHVIALSQVVPNNVSGGVLTPFDLCDIATSNQDQLSVGYQNTHTGGLPLPNQGSVASMHPPGGLNSSVHGLQGSPGMGIGNNLGLPSSQFAGAREAKFSVPRATSLPVEEQQRLQQYNAMPPGRNGQPSNLSSSGSLSVNDRGVRMLPGGHGVGMIPGMNRSMAMVRPGLHGIPSSSMLNSGSMLASKMGGMPSNMNVPGQGSTMFRSRDALHMVRPGHSSEHQRQMVSTELQMQATQSNSPGVPPFGGLSSGFSNQSASVPLQTYPGHPQQQHPTPQQHPHVHSSTHPHLTNSNHSTNTEQQAYLRHARERQMQQRILQRQQQHQQHTASSALMTHVQTPSQLPMSSSLQSGSQLQSPSSSQSVSLPCLTPSTMTHVSAQPQQQQKHQLPSQGIGRNPQNAGGEMVNQVGKQRQRQAQQLQQSGRHHPLQRQQSESQQAKLLKGNGRSNILMHQNLPRDPSHLNGLSANTGSAEDLIQNQGLYPESGLNAMKLSKSQSSPQILSHTQPQKTYPNTGPAASKPVQQMSPHLDGGSQGQVPQIPSTITAGCSNQGLPSMGMPSHNHQQVQGQPQPPVKVLKQSQRSTQQNCRVNADSLSKLQVDHSPLEQYAVDTSPSRGLLSACVESSNPITVSSYASTAVQKVQDSICDSSVNSESSLSGPCSGPRLALSAGNEPIPSVSQFLGKRQLSAHGAQWQQQSQLQPAPLQSILPHKQSQKQQRIEQTPHKTV